MKKIIVLIWAMILLAGPVWAFPPIFGGGGGAGTVTASGTPTNHQWPGWTTATDLKGFTVTPSKPVCTDGSGDPAACTNLTDLVVPAPVEIDIHAAGVTITAAQLRCVNMASAHNVSQAAADISNDLPAAAANLCLWVTFSDARSNYNRLCAPEGDNMYIDGGSTSYDCVGVAATVAKNAYYISSIRTGASSFAWKVSSDVGTVVGYNGVKP